MHSRPIIFALAVMVFGVLLIVPIFSGSIFFAYSTGGASLHAGGGILLTFALIAVLLAARRFFHRP